MNDYFLEQLTEKWEQSSKIIQSEINKSRGLYPTEKIDKWFNEIWYSSLRKLPPEFAEDEFLLEFLNTIITRTYLRKHKVLRMKKNGSNYSESCNSLLIAFDRLTDLDKVIRINWFNLLENINMGNEFLLANRINDGLELITNLQGKINKHFSFIKQYSQDNELDIMEGMSNITLNMMRSIFLVEDDKKLQLILLNQYKFITAPYLKYGYKLEFPDKFKKNNTSGCVGFYNDAIYFFQHTNNDIQEEFDNLYKNLLVKNSNYEHVIEQIINLFNDNQ